MERQRLGHSEEGRPIEGLVLGDGPRRMSLVAGAHADEPVGPCTLRAFDAAPDGWTCVIVPDVNPDGAARNAVWWDRFPDRDAYRAHRRRELPGRDVEFGYPAMRPENEAVSAFLRAHGPFDLHLSLHGMGEQEGALLLIERSWVDRTRELRAAYADALRDAGLPLLDRDRDGEKGFEYIGPGFWTTPRSDAMRAHFEALGDAETAARFHRNSMEFVRSLGGDPLCLVTEIPLFVAGEAVPVETAMALQRRAIELGIETVA
ncbi:MAG: peptidase M14 [Planctomycetota bacterium]